MTWLCLPLCMFRTPGLFRMFGALGEVEERLLEVVFAGLLPDRGRSVGGKQLAEAEQPQAMAANRLIQVVGRDDQRDSALVKLGKVVPERDAQLRVDTHRRLVEEDQLWFMDE